VPAGDHPLVHVSGAVDIPGLLEEHAEVERHARRLPGVGELHDASIGAHRARRVTDLHQQVAEADRRMGMSGGDGSLVRLARPLEVSLLVEKDAKEERGDRLLPFVSGRNRTFVGLVCARDVSCSTEEVAEVNGCLGALVAVT
jgi:hypothetical protein